MLRHHKATGQGYVVLNNRAIYLGRFGQAKTTQKYHQAIAEWIAGDRQLRVEPEQMTIKELLAYFWQHAESYYARADGKLSSEGRNFKLALKPIKELYGLLSVTEFGPRCLRAVREQMIRQGWCRPYINKSINKIRHVFKWAVSHELVPSSVLHGLQSLAGLRQGRSGPHPDAANPSANNKNQPSARIRGRPSHIQLLGLGPVND